MAKRSMTLDFQRERVQTFINDLHSKYSGIGAMLFSIEKQNYHYEVVVRGRFSKKKIVASAKSSNFSELLSILKKKTTNQIQKLKRQERYVSLVHLNASQKTVDSFDGADVYL